MRLLLMIHDPLHKLLITIVVDALYVLFTKEKHGGYHWIQPGQATSVPNGKTRYE